MRKGQESAAGAAILVAIIAAMILFYLLFLPPGERIELLEGSGGLGDPGSGGPGGLLRGVLLSQNPGRLFPPAPNEVVHTIPSFTIFTQTNAMEIKRKSSLLVKNGVFSDSTPFIDFIFDRTTTKNIMLSFNAKKSSGNLIIRLNGEELFNQELETQSPPPIILPGSMLKTVNDITFEASSPGAAFWRINVHELANIIISGEVTDRSGSIANQHFSVTGAEFDAMEFAELGFLPNCEPEFAGRLKISMNNNQVYSGFADCGVNNKVEVAKEFLKQGDNVIRFVSEEGQYLVDLVKVTSKIAGQAIPIFYFNLPTEAFDLVYYNDVLLFITLRFSDARSQKAAVLNLNGFETSFNIQDLVFQTQIDPNFLLPGPNSLMIIPQGQPVDVVELRVELG